MVVSDVATSQLSMEKARCGSCTCNARAGRGLERNPGLQVSEKQSCLEDAETQRCTRPTESALGL